jgi:hypothetical protein
MFKISNIVIISDNKFHIIFYFFDKLFPNPNFIFRDSIQSIIFPTIWQKEIAAYSWIQGVWRSFYNIFSIYTKFLKNSFFQNSNDWVFIINWLSLRMNSYFKKIVSRIQFRNDRNVTFTITRKFNFYYILNWRMISIISCCE